jgi:NTE family protein
MSEMTHRRAGPRIGLVLGGGGARGMAHIGVLQRLCELGVRPHCVVGTSAGALVGAAYAAGRLDFMADLVRHMDWRRMAQLFVEVNFPRSGLLSGRRIEQLLQEIYVVSQIAELKMPFAAVATDLEHEEEVVLVQGGLVEAIRASIAIPGVFTPVHREGRLLVDGGLINPLPISVARQMGADLVLAVDVNLRPGTGVRQAGAKPRRGRPHIDEFLNRMVEHLPALRGSMTDTMQRWRRDARRRRDSLSVFDVLTKSLRIFENQVMRNRMRLEPPDILLQPAVGEILTLDFQKSPGAIAAGAAAVDERLDELGAFLPQREEPARLTTAGL